MDPSPQHAAALRPLLAHAVGDPSMAALGGEELDRIMDATELVVGEIVAASRADAARYHSAAMLGAEEVAARRRLQIYGLRYELMDRATDLAMRFESLLDELEAAEALLGRDGTEEPVETDEKIAAIRTIVSERRPVAAAPDAYEQPIVFGQAHGDPAPYAEEAVYKRRWWHRLRGEAA